MKWKVKCVYCKATLFMGSPARAREGVLCEDCVKASNDYYDSIYHRNVKFKIDLYKYRKSDYLYKGKE